MQSYARPGMSMTSGHQATIAELRAMFQLKSWQGIYGRIQADIDASHRGHSSTPLTRGGLAHCWLSEGLDLIFQPDFLTYVQWPYFSAVEQTQKVTGRADSLDIYAHQLFEDQNQNFALRFSEKGVIFQNRKNIEDTLFL